MFGGQPEQVSESELKDAEFQATRNVQVFAVTCAALWFSPHVVAWAQKLF